MSVLLCYTIEFTIGAENDVEDKADIDEKIHDALKHLGATIIRQAIEEER